MLAGKLPGATKTRQQIHTHLMLGAELIRTRQLPLTQLPCHPGKLRQNHLVLMALVKTSRGDKGSADQAKDEGQSEDAHEDEHGHG